MTNLILYGYYYRYRQARKSVKDLVTADNFSTAKTFLDSYKAQHDNYVQNGNISTEDESFTAIDSRSLQHAKDHLESVIELDSRPIEQESQKQAAIDALNEQ